MATENKTKLSLYYVSTDRGCGIRAARDEDDVWRQLAREVGTDNVSDVHEATEQEIAWVRGMGGHVPSLS